MDDEDLGKILAHVGRIGTLEAERGNLSIVDWQDLANRRSDLQQAPPRIGRNPITGDRVALKQPPCQRAVQRDGRWTAWFSWTAAPGRSKDMGIIDVWVADDIADEMLKIAREVAAELNAPLNLNSRS